MAAMSVRRTAIGLVALLTPLLASGQPGQLFRSGVHTVPVYATALDQSGAPVPDLTSSDFQVFDNGHPRPLTVFHAGGEPISIAILLDNSPSVFNVSERAQAFVVSFLRQLRPDDHACLGTFSHVVTLDPEFTNDQERLVHHLGDDAPFPAGTALWDAIEAGREALRHEGGRRVILIVTDAQDNCSRIEAGDARTRLERDGVMLCGIGIRGAQGLDASQIAATARATGGSYREARPTEDLASTAQRIADELHRQYALGFSPAALDDRVHRIDVRVTRRGVSVRARRSYFADSHADGR
jgi:VWFA-related protein